MHSLEKRLQKSPPGEVEEQEVAAVSDFVWQHIRPVFSRMIRSWSVAGNSTANPDNATHVLSPKWSSHTVWQTICAILSVLLNAALLALFARQRHLRTSFSIYLMSLLVSNILFSAFHSSLIIADQLYAVWQFGNPLCTFHLYTAWTFTGVTVHIHVLMALNRVWAMLWPLSYKNHHSFKTTVVMFFCMGVYVHAVCLPGVVFDMLYYRLEPRTYGCNLNMEALKPWAIVTMLLIYDLPILLVFVAYLLIWSKEGVIRRKVAGDTKQSVARSYETRPRDTNRRRRENSFAVLTFLTATMLVCWTPNEVYYTINLFMDFDVPEVRVAGFALYSLQVLLDPLLILLSMRDLRKAAADALRWIAPRRRHDTKESISRRSAAAGKMDRTFSHCPPANSRDML